MDTTRLGGSVSGFDAAALGSSLSVQFFVCAGFSLSSFGRGRLGGDFFTKESGSIVGSGSALARFELGSYLTLISFARLGSSASVFEGFQVHQSAPIRGSATIGRWPSLSEQ